jgi:hypothetical protein
MNYRRDERLVGWRNGSRQLDLPTMNQSKESILIFDVLPSAKIVIWCCILDVHKLYYAKVENRKFRNATNLQIPPQTHPSPTNDDCGSLRTLSPAVQLPTSAKDLGGGKPRERP